MEPITLNLQLILIAAAAMYGILSYIIGATLCRDGLSRVPQYIDTGDRVLYFLAWLVSPVWMIPYLMSKMLFAGVHYKGPRR